MDIIITTYTIIESGYMKFQHLNVPLTLLLVSILISGLLCHNTDSRLLYGTSIIFTFTQIPGFEKSSVCLRRSRVNTLLSLSLILGQWLRFTFLMTLSCIHWYLFYWGVFVKCIENYLIYIIVGGGAYLYFYLKFHYNCYCPISLNVELTVIGMLLGCLMHKFIYLFNKHISFENG